MSGAKGTTPVKRGRKPGSVVQAISIPEPDTLHDDEMAKVQLISRGRQSDRYTDVIARLLAGEKIAYRKIDDQQKRVIMSGLRQQQKTYNKLPTTKMHLQFGYIAATNTLTVWNTSTEETKTGAEETDDPEGIEEPEE